MLINDVPAECIIQASNTYQVPAALIISVLKTENGRVGMAKRNVNGTYDYGPMQINSVWLNKIKVYGYTQEDIQYNACDNINVGTWILAQSVVQSDDLWRGVGNYHSHTFSQNVTYRTTVSRLYQAMNAALS